MSFKDRFKLLKQKINLIDTGSLIAEEHLKSIKFSNLSESSLLIFIEVAKKELKSRGYDEEKR